MRYLLLLSSCFFATIILAQPKIEFDKTDHDFGDIEEEGGYAEFTFNFVNEGDEPIKITNVKASCGCTTPGWTREEVLPGDSGFVKARYNPKNRPGRFRKSLRLTTSDPVSDQTLYIMGMVKPKPKTPEKEYPIVASDLRLKYQALNMGKVTTEKPIERSFDVYNGSDSVTSLNSSSMIVPGHVEVSLEPEFINPKAFGKLSITYDPTKKNDFGFVSDNLILDTTVNNSLSVMAVIEEYFPEMTAEELDNAPKLEISNRNFKFETVSAGTILERSFELSNAGKEKLEFRAIKSNCECVTYEMKKNSIKKGKSQTLTVRFDTSDMRGNQFKSITIYSNDPVSPTQMININGKVEKDN